MCKNTCWPIHPFYPAKKRQDVIRISFVTSFFWYRAELAVQVVDADVAWRAAKVNVVLQVGAWYMWPGGTGAVATVVVGGGNKGRDQHLMWCTFMCLKFWDLSLKQNCFRKFFALRGMFNGQVSRGLVHEWRIKPISVLWTHEHLYKPINWKWIDKV